MPGVFIEGLCTGLTKGLAANTTATSFTAANGIPTVTMPVGTATRTAIRRKQGVNDRVSLRVYPYGGNADNDVIITKVLGWQRIMPATLGQRQETDVGAHLWISTIVAEVSGILSSALLGIANYPVIATEFFCDTLTLTTGNAVLFQGTADIDIAHFLCDVSPFEIVTIDGDLGAGGDTMNWLYSF